MSWFILLQKGCPGSSLEKEIDDKRKYRVLRHARKDVLASLSGESSVKMIILDYGMFMEIEAFLEVGRVPVIVCCKSKQQFQELGRRQGEGIWPCGFYENMQPSASAITVQVFRLIKTGKISSVLVQNKSKRAPRRKSHSVFETFAKRRSQMTQPLPQQKPTPRPKARNPQPKPNARAPHRKSPQPPKRAPRSKSKSPQPPKRAPRKNKNHSIKTQPIKQIRQSISRTINPKRSSKRPRNSMVVGELLDFSSDFPEPTPQQQNPKPRERRHTLPAKFDLSSFFPEENQSTPIPQRLKKRKPLPKPPQRSNQLHHPHHNFPMPQHSLHSQPSHQSPISPHPSPVSPHPQMRLNQDPSNQPKPSTAVHPKHLPEPTLKPHMHNQPPAQLSENTLNHSHPKQPSKEIQNGQGHQQNRVRQLKSSKREKPQPPLPKPRRLPTLKDIQKIVDMHNDFENWTDLSSPPVSLQEEDFEIKEGTLLPVLEEDQAPTKATQLLSELVLQFDELISQPDQQFNHVSPRLSAPEKQKLSLMEIIKEERTYYQSMNVLKTHYFEPLKQLLPQPVWKNMVRNFEMLVGLHRPLLEKLNAIVSREENFPTFSPQVYSDFIQLYIQFCPAFKLYSDYFANLHVVLNQMKREQERNEKLREFLHSKSQELRQKSKTSRYTLTSFLQYPIQFLCRHDITLKNLLKRSPAQAPYMDQLKHLHKSMRDVLSYCNKKKFEAEHQEILLRLQKKGIRIFKTGRKLLKYSEVTRIKPKKRYRCNIYLFNDLFLWEDKRKGMAKRPPKKIHFNDGNVVVKLVSQTRRSPPEEEGKKFFIFDPGNHLGQQERQDSLMMTFLTETPEQAKDWVQLISKILNDLAGDDE